MANGFVKIIATDAHTDDSLDLGYGFKSGDDRDGRPIFEVWGYVLDTVTLSPELESAVMKEAANYFIEEQYYYRFYHEGHDHLEEERKTYQHEIADSRCHVIVKDGQFFGVAMRLEETSGNGWNGSSYERCCLFLSNGEIIGNNKKAYHFSGEETETTRESIYTLKKHKN